LEPADTGVANDHRSKYWTLAKFVNESSGGVGSAFPTETSLFAHLSVMTLQAGRRPAHSRPLSHPSIFLPGGSGAARFPAGRAGRSHYRPTTIGAANPFREFAGRS
jgi:hypothetical protein